MTAATEPVSMTSSAISLLLNPSDDGGTAMAFDLSDPGSAEYSTTWTLSFPSSLNSSYVGGSLPDGAYSLTVNGSEVSYTDG